MRRREFISLLGGAAKAEQSRRGRHRTELASFQCSLSGLSKNSGPRSPCGVFLFGNRQQLNRLLYPRIQFTNDRKRLKAN
jgi:hypothetical protein